MEAGPPDALSVGTFARSGSVLLGGQITRALIQGLGVVLLSRMLSPGDFGALGMITAIVSFATIFGDFGLSVAAIRVPSITPPQWANLFWANVGLGLSASIVVAMIAPVIASYYGAPALTYLTLMISVTFTLNAASAQYRAQLVREGRYVALMIVETVPPLCGLVAGIATAVLAPGPTALATQQVVSAAALLVFGMIACGHLPGLPRANGSIRSFLTIGLGATMYRLATSLSTDTAPIPIGRLTGETEVGYYTRAYFLYSLVMSYLLSPLSRLVVSTLSRLADARASQATVFRLQRLFSLTAGLGVSLIGGAAVPAVKVILGSQWAPSAALLSIMSLAVIFHIAEWTSYWACVAAGRLKALLTVQAPIRFAMVLGVFLIAPRGTSAVAWLVSGGLILVGLACQVLVLPAIGFSRRDSVTTLGQSIVPAIVTYLGARCASQWWGPTLSSGTIVVMCLGWAILVLLATLSLSPVLRRDAMGIVPHRARAWLDDLRSRPRHSSRS